MKVAFADTSYYLALTNASDQHHSRVCKWTADWNGAFVTTAWVVAELANAMSQTANRPFFLSLLRDLHTDQRVTVLVMEDYQVHDAATLDHHFAQAGFNVLLSDS